jgi:CheY-like chemotaxis protein
MIGLTDRGLASPAPGLLRVSGDLAMITEAREARSAFNAPPDPSKAHGILVVDDDDGMRDVLNIWLKHQGYGVWTAATGQQAVDQYTHYRDAISVVLMDVNMPGKDGPQTLAALREIDPQVCCFFMNGKASRYGEAELRNLGAQQVVQKPFRLIDLGQPLWKLAAPIQRQTAIQDDLWRDDGGQG